MAETPTAARFSFPDAWDLSSGFNECSKLLAAMKTVLKEQQGRRSAAGELRISGLKENTCRFCEKVLNIDPILQLVGSFQSTNFLWQLFLEEVRDVLEQCVASVKRVTSLGNAVAFLKIDQIITAYDKCMADVMELLVNIPEKQFTGDDEQHEYAQRISALREALEEIPDYVGREQLTEVRKIYMKIWTQELNTSLAKAGIEGTVEVTTLSRLRFIQDGRIRILLVLIGLLSIDQTKRFLSV